MVTPADPAGLPSLRGERLAGRVLQDVALTGAGWLVAGGVAGGLLALAGVWEPVTGLVTLLVLLAAVWRVVHALPAHPIPVWVAALLALAAVGGAVWAGVTHAEQVLPRRDSGSYLQSAIDLAEHHERPIEVDPADLGGPQTLDLTGVTLSSPAFYEIGSPQDPAVQPQFMVGPSVWWSVAIWLGGWTAAFWAPGLVTGLFVLAVGLLTSRTVGARWGPLAAAAVAACFPVLHTARSTYSEPLANAVLAAGLLAVVLAARADGGGEGADSRVAVMAGWVGGLLVGAGAVFRPDVLREATLLLIVAGLAMVATRPHGRALFAGTVVGSVVTFALALATSYRYLGSIAKALVPLSVASVIVLVVVLATVRAARRGRRLPPTIRAWLPRASAGAVVLAGLLLVTRPLWLTARHSATSPGARYLAVLQAEQGLPVDGSRSYAEHSVAWMSWWVGPVTLLLALAALTVFAHRLATAWVTTDTLPHWTAPLVVGAGSTLLTLLRPSITPDHPWADRRLIIALAFALVLAVAVIATVTRWGTRRLPSILTIAATTLLTIGVLVPLGLATAPHATERVEAGERDAVDAVCAATKPGDVALTLDNRAANEWPQVFRGVCGIPALSTTSALRRDRGGLLHAVAQIDEDVAAHGGRLLLVSAESTDGLAAVGAVDVRQVVGAAVREDPRLIEERPESLVDLQIQVWFGRFPSSTPAASAS